MSVSVTALYAGALALLFIGLSARVSRLRGTTKIGIGYGENRDLARAIRVHGNFSEYVPLALVLMLIVENTALPQWCTHGLGLALVVGRVLHAYGLSVSAGVTASRFVGTTLTWLVVLVGGLLSLYVALMPG
jgi:uncharacterized membrane protein YecN with MAPEG domain